MNMDSADIDINKHLSSDIRMQINEHNSSVWTLIRDDPSKARELLSDVLSRASELEYTEGLAYTFLNLSWLEYYESNFDEAEHAAVRSLDLLQQCNDLFGLSLVFQCLGSIAQERGELDRAMEYSIKAVDLARNSGDKKREAAALNCAGKVLNDGGEIHEALHYFIQASSILTELSDDELKADKQSARYEQADLTPDLFVNIGLAFNGIGETKNALSYLEVGLVEAEEKGDLHAELRALKGLAVAARRQGKRDEAALLLENAYKKAESGTLIPIVTDILLEQAVLFIETDQFSDALTVLEKAIALAEQHGLISKLAECFRFRSLVHESTGHLDQALSDFKHFHDAMESISADLIARSKKEAETRFELEKARQEAQIYRLKNIELKTHKDELEQTYARLKAVAEIGRAVTSSLDIDELSRIVYDNISTILDASSFCLAARDPDEDIVEFKFFIQNGKIQKSVQIPLDSTDSFSAWAIRKNQPIHIDSVKNQAKRYVSRLFPTMDKKTESLIYVPLSIGGRVIGSMGVQSRKPHAYTEDDIRFLSSLGAYVAIAIENSRSHAELLRLNSELKREGDTLARLAKKISRIANHDNLTGLPNRMLLGELLDKALQRARRQHTFLAVYFMDLDDFKPINDHYGHHAGDLALIDVANRLKGALRSSDAVARIGGDEFIAFAPDLESPEHAVTVAEKLLSALEEPVMVEGEACTIGVSIGIALYPEDGDSPDLLIRKADEAMYSIKRKSKKGYMFFGGTQSGKK